MTSSAEPQPNIAEHVDDVPASFWVLVVLTGGCAGVAAGLLMKLLRLVQHLAWSDRGDTFLDAVAATPPPWRVAILAGAGLLAALALMAMRRLKEPSVPGGLESTIWLHDGHLPPVRTTLKALLSIVLVGLGASLGREAAPKQIGALLGSLLADWRDLSASHRQLLAAAGAGAGIAAVYNVPFGGALFMLEVLLGTVALPLVAPALLATLTGTAAAWLLLPNEPTYDVPTMPLGVGLVVFSVLFGPLAGPVSALFVKAVAYAGAWRPRGLAVLPVSIAVFTLVGIVAVGFPQVPGNGKDIVELAVLDKMGLATLAALLLLKPLATLACLGTGAPGGLFTPTIACGALLGAVSGHLWLGVWSGTPAGAFALLGGAAMLAATTKGPVSAVVLMLELTRHVDGLMVPMLIVVALATLVAHRIDPRSTYTSR